MGLLPFHDDIASSGGFQKRDVAGNKLLTEEGMKYNFHLSIVRTLDTLWNEEIKRTI